MSRLQSFFIVFLTLFFSCIVQIAQATHLRAGQITAVRASPTSLEYRFTLTVYRDDCANCVELSPTAVLVFDSLGSIEIPLAETRFVGNDIEEGKYFGSFTFPGNGPFRVSYVERFRNGCIRNMTNPLETELFVETEIIVNSFLGGNSTPILLALPVDNAAIGSKFLHNPGAYDPDGDSLSFSLVTPKKGFDEEVDNYRTLTQFLSPTAEQGGAPFFGIDPVTGTLTWDTPLEPGCYNIAIRVTEWRENSQGTFNYLGFVIRDMQIIVGTFNNRRPQLMIPTNACVAVGEEIDETISATDPEGNPIVITPISQVFDASFPTPRATTDPSQPQQQPSPASLNFEWTPSCDQIRERPYQVIFNASDVPPNTTQSLVDIQVWEIQVVGPRPTGLTATPDNVNDRITLNWDTYQCVDQADEMIIWRKEGCSTGEPMNCDVAAPDGQGYIEIARLPANATSFIDENVNIGLSYSYRISATFPAPERGDSYASEEVCLALLVDVPLFTKVDVLETSTTTGRVDVEFIDPFQFDPPLSANTPFSYRVFRYDGLDGNANPVEVFTATSQLGDLQTFSFEDTDLNTLEQAYHYQIAFFVDNPSFSNFRDSSDKASTVRLSLQPASNCITVTWDYNVPWSNQFQTHDIARREGGEPDIVADKIGEDFPVGRGFGTFVDENDVTQNILYGYKSLTRGSYYNPTITAAYSSVDILVNTSQSTEGTTDDITPPCPPILEVSMLDCDQFDYTSNPPFENVLNWVNPTSANGTGNGNCGELNGDCEFEEEFITAYRVYYKPTTDTENYTLIEEIAGNMTRNFTHDGLDSYAGCYVVTSVDIEGNESAFSNEVCVDNCLRFELPNVFTPNGDNIGDTFRAVNYPLNVVSENGGRILPPAGEVELNFVETVEFTVYNRWGKKVYFRDNDINIRWNGQEGLSGSSPGDGNPLPTGIYYYDAKVRFISVDPRNAERMYQGWVQILR